MDAVAPDLGSPSLVTPIRAGVFMSAGADRDSSSPWSILRRPWLALANSRDEEPSPEHLWDMHGTSLFSLACTVLGDEKEALRAVSLGMVDLYSPSDDRSAITADASLRAAARCVYERCRAILAEPSSQRTMVGPPLMVWLGDLACSQRDALAMCVFGGHDYRQAAALLGVAPDVVARLLTSALQELGGHAAARGSAGR
jgi:hypothetical protein